MMVASGTSINVPNSVGTPKGLTGAVGRTLGPPFVTAGAGAFTGACFAGAAAVVPVVAAFGLDLAGFGAGAGVWVRGGTLGLGCGRRGAGGTALNDGVGWYCIAAG